MIRVSRRCEGRRRSVRRNNSPLLRSTIRSCTSRKPLCSVPTGNRNRPSWAACVAPNRSREPADFGFGLADDEHLLAHAGFVQFVAHAVDVAAESLDRFDLEPASGFQRRRGHGRRRHRRKTERLLENFRNGVEPERCPLSLWERVRVRALLIWRFAMI